jgi:hypothetical protein
MNKNLFCEVLKIMFLFFLFFFFMTLIVKFIKHKNPICDSEKKSKFILECLKADGANDTQGSSACEQMSLRLYCK